MFTLSVPDGALSQSALLGLPYCVFENGYWRTAICRDSIETLQGWVAGGLLSDPQNIVTSLQADKFSFAKEGRVMQGNSKDYPYTIWKSRCLDDGLDHRIGAGIYFTKETSKLRVPASSAGTLALMVAEGTLADPDKLFSDFSADVVVCFDARDGDFRCVGPGSADSLFENEFPRVDIVQSLRDKGYMVAFSDPFTEEVYRGALAFEGNGIQPEGITVDLFPYQKRSVAMIAERTGVGVFLAPGLGKTLVAIAAGQELLNRGVIDRIVVSPPGAVARQWAREITRFTGLKSDDVIVTQGHKDRRYKLYQQGRDAQWVIIHHDLLSRDYDQLSYLVDSRTLFVIDESHKGNNYTSARHKALAKLSKNAGRRIVMSGTPVLNSVMDWYSTVSTFVQPHIFGLKHFLSRYVLQDTFGGHNGARHLDDLAQRSKYHFIRYRKEDVAQHLAPLQVSSIPVQVDDAYRSALMQVHFAAADELTQHFAEVEDSEVLGNMTAYGMLRALCSSPRILFDSNSGGAKTLTTKLNIPEVDGPKVDLVLDIAGKFQEKGERIVIFTYSRSVVSLLEKRFTDLGIRFVSYHGGTNDADRDAAATAFTSCRGDGSDPTVFLATDAAAEGLNLGAYCCTLVNIDLPWTAGRLEQRYNRIHRVDGTHSSYIAVNLTISNTVEDSILQKIESKANIADVIFGERTAGDITGLSTLTSRNDSYVEALREYQAAQGQGAVSDLA